MFFCPVAVLLIREVPIISRLFLHYQQGEMYALFH